MNSREKILSAITAGKHTAVPLPDKLSPMKMEGQLEQFISILQTIGGTAQLVKSREEVENAYPDESGNRWMINCLVAQEDVISRYSAAELEAVDIVVVEGKVAVAENAAIWIGERQMKHRILPFICKKLVILIHGNQIVSTMHEAYEHIEVMADGYGVFIAGPSKTADIEQSLVIGAHGPLELEVLIIHP